MRGGRRRWRRRSARRSSLKFRGGERESRHPDTREHARLKRHDSPGPESPTHEVSCPVRHRRTKPLTSGRRVAGATGFEPAVFAFGVESERFPDDPRESLDVVFPRKSDPAHSLPSRSIPAEHGNFGAPVVHGKAASRRVKSYLLTVREVASLLRVGRARVYSLCERGQLAHIRIGASIRIHRAEVEFFLRSPPPR